MTSRPVDLLGALKGGRLFLSAVMAILLLAALGRTFSAAYVEILWQAQTGYLSVFWRRMLWEWGVRIVCGVGVGALVFANLRIASATLGSIQIRRRFGNLEISEQMPKQLVAWGMLASAVLLGFWFGASVPSGLGRLGLLALNAGPWGLTDPFLAQDVGFYVFWLPVWEAGVTYALVVTFLLFTLSTAAYATTGALVWTGGRLQAQEVTRKHLGAILSVALLLIAVRLWLGRYGLLLNGNSAVQGIFGFADAEARLPALQTLSVICIGAAGATMFGAWKNRPQPVIGSFVLIMLGTMLIGNFYPSLIQSFRVEPNELERETPFIEHSLRYTRLAFGLEDLERRQFAVESDASVNWVEAEQQFAGLPVWGAGPLLSTYRELEALFPYYDFDQVAIDRYATASGVQPVAISVRQVEPRGIQDPNWQNLHLRERYVAGVGAVASLATTRSPEGRPQMLVRGIPPEVPAGSLDVPGLSLDRPEIFFGTRRQQEYAVITPGPEQYLAPDRSIGTAGVDFPEGIQLTSTLRTAILAWRFRAVNLLFASELTEESRFVHRTQVIERALAIAPSLRFPEDPYPVMEDGRVVWVLEGFTGSLYFPLSAVQSFGTIRRAVSYVRNSVKVTVDAVTGNIDFYRVPIEDPLADAYAAAYPGLFKPMSEMPASLRAHLRYPRPLLDLQSRVLLQYHQETAPAFHGQQDVWDEPEELSNSTSPVRYRAEYGLYALPGEDEARFNLTTVFVPADRQNLTAILAARTDDAGIPETVLFDIPVADQVPGPRQIEALVEQDPLISQQFSLWRTGGSEVWTGHLHLVPVGSRLLYMEPVFLAAEEDAIPELRRFVVSDGRRVVMTETLSEAIEQLAGLESSLPSVARSADDQATIPLFDTGGDGVWPAAALDLLEEADAHARDGNWQGYGEALDRLRDMLQRLQNEGG
jgi:uncharacterized membrane protein (UPF0182 family)